MQLAYVGADIVGSVVGGWFERFLGVYLGG